MLTFRINIGFGTLIDQKLFATDDMAKFSFSFLSSTAGAFLWGAAKQKSNQKIRDLKALLSVRQNTKEIEDEVDLLSDDAVSDQLRKWLRDRDQR